MWLGATESRRFQLWEHDIIITPSLLLFLKRSTWWTLWPQFTPEGEWPIGDAAKNQLTTIKRRTKRRHVFPIYHTREVPEAPRPGQCERRETSLCGRWDQCHGAHKDIIRLCACIINRVPNRLECMQLRMKKICTTKWRDCRIICCSVYYIYYVYVIEYRIWGEGDELP